MEPDLRVGRIIWAEIADPNGHVKSRPGVIVACPDDEAVPLTVVAITSHFPSEVPDDYVELPWHAQRHPRTGLNRRSAAVCFWTGFVPRTSIVNRAGVVPPTLMVEILTKARLP